MRQNRLTWHSFRFFRFKMGSIGILLLALGFYGCGPTAEKKPDRMVFRIIETSDVHGAIFPYDFIQDKPMDGSLSRAYSYITDQRKKAGQEVILLDNGDILQGQPVVYYYNFEDTTDTHICARVMNFMKYDAGTVGNHDIEAGHAVYDKLVREFHFPWMAANAVRNHNNKPYFKPYTVIQRKGIRIVVLGMITPAIPKWLPPDIWKGMHFNDMVQTARKWVPIIQKKEHPDILIGMFHSGYDYTYGGGTADQYKNENASALVAEKVPGFDLILIGHDHKALNTMVDAPGGKKIPLLDPAHNALWVSSVKIKCSLDHKTGKYAKEIQGALVSMKGYNPDPVFLKKFREDSVRVMKYVSRPVAIFTKPVSSTDALFGDSPFMGLIHTVQLNLSGADISFAAPLSLHAIIPKGKVYVKDMFKLYRFENYLYTMRMKGNEIKKYLEYSYGNWLAQMQGPDDPLLKYKNVPGKKNKHFLASPYYGFDSAAGIDYVVDVRKPAGQRITILSLSDGKPFDTHKWYKVAVNSYRGNGGGGFLTRGCGIPYDSLAARIIHTTDKDLRYYMMKWMEKQKTVTPAALHNWKIIPEKWATIAAKREKQYFK